MWASDVASHWDGVCGKDGRLGGEVGQVAVGFGLGESCSDELWEIAGGFDWSHGGLNWQSSRVLWVCVQAGNATPEVFAVNVRHLQELDGTRRPL